MIEGINYGFSKTGQGPNIMKYVIIQITIKKPFEKQAIRVCFVYS